MCHNAWPARTRIKNSTLPKKHFSTHNLLHFSFVFRGDIASYRFTNTLLHFFILFSSGKNNIVSGDHEILAVFSFLFFFFFFSFFFFHLEGKIPYWVTMKSYAQIHFSYIDHKQNLNILIPPNDPSGFLTVKYCVIPVPVRYLKQIIS